MTFLYKMTTTIRQFPTFPQTTYNMTCTCKLVCVPQVTIDAAGTFKYILVQTYEDSQPRSVIVRGSGKHEWHNNIFDEVKEELKPLDCKPLGGGKISINPEAKTINIYGNSTGYGQADHELAAKMIREAYPEYTVVVGEEPKEKKDEIVVEIKAIEVTK